MSGYDDGTPEHYDFERAEAAHARDVCQPWYDDNQPTHAEAEADAREDEKRGRP